MHRTFFAITLVGLTVFLVIMLALYGVILARPTGLSTVVVQPGNIVKTDETQADTGPTHILLIGTSLTALGNWPVALELALRKCAPQDVVIERLAKPGEGIRWGLPAVEARILDENKPRPDIAVVEFSGNDAAFRQGLPLFLARRHTITLVETLRQAGSIVFLSTMNPGWGIKAVIRPGQASYHAMYRDVAAATHAGLIDTSPEWLALDEEIRKRLVPDGGHPSDEGARLITIPAYIAALEPLVCGQT